MHTLPPGLLLKKWSGMDDRVAGLGLCEILQWIVGVRKGHGLVPSVAGDVEGRAGLVLPGVQATQMPDAIVVVRELAVGLAAGRGRGAEGVLVVGQQAALLVALAQQQLLILQARPCVGLAATDGKLATGVVLPEVQAVQEAAALAAGCGSHPVGELHLSEDAALLVADTQVQLLIFQARARLVRAGTVSSDGVATASHPGGDGEFLVRRARVLLATRPRARADGVLPTSEEGALLVAEPFEQLLVALADVAVVEVLRGLQRRVAACASGGLPREEGPAPEKCTIRRARRQLCHCRRCL
mmetsp:Transcript_90486/g.270045  ORF Transcript_90486/g.270045 Transcript_90486/m.270045 type:complete len:299 (-) Transcript_90486:269-1165(-)